MIARLKKLAKRLGFRQGVTRIVLLTGKSAIKFPNVLNGWHNFITGLNANICEEAIWAAATSQMLPSDPKLPMRGLLCPVRWHSWGGWLIVMQRCVRELTFEEYCELDLTPWHEQELQGDDKARNYGWLNGKVVKLDYGHFMFMVRWWHIHTEEEKEPTSATESTNPQPTAAPVDTAVVSGHRQRPADTNNQPEVDYQQALGDLARENAQRDQERMERSLRMRISPEMVMNMYRAGQVLKADFEKYFLCHDMDYVPPFQPEPASFVLQPVTTKFVPILNYTTKVSVTKTVAELTLMLAKAGCREVSTRFEAGTPKSLHFFVDYQNQVLRFQLPANPAGVLVKLKRAKIASSFKTLEHAERVAWRIIKDWVEAQLAVIESGQAEVAEVFLPYALDGNGHTLFQNLQQGTLLLKK